ncbi:hypothetical protein BJ741DRAFT_714646 [Chytriomyces cf. hyalinus JEL632]|nr:hypothetical protein BJ741DRAFT_714646 [Chytriomyces cf. hyalinus JEL632]
MSTTEDTKPSSKTRDDRIRELEAILNRQPESSPDRSSEQTRRYSNSLHHQTSITSIDPQTASNPKSLPQTATLSRQLSQLAHEISELDMGNPEAGQKNSDARLGSPKQTPAINKSGRQSLSQRPPVAQSLKLKNQPSPSSTGWVPLISKDFKGKPKNALPATDKTLLQILEEERSKYQALEQTYHALLAEVKSLQTSHIHEIKAADKRADATVKSAQKQLMEKSEELISVQGDLKRLQTRLENIEKSRTAEAERAEFQFMRLGGAKRESDQKNVVLEKLLDELKARKGELEDRLTKREAEMKKLILMYKDRETELENERNARMRSELQVLKLEQSSEQKESDIRVVKEQLRIKSITADESIKLKEALTDACRDVEQLLQREKMYLEEIDAANRREKESRLELDELNSVYQKSVEDCDRATSRDLAKGRELEIIKGGEAKLKSEVTNLYHSNRAQNDTIAELDKELRIVKQEKATILADVSELRKLLGDATNQVKFKNDEIKGLRDVETQLRRDAQTLKNDLFATQDDYAAIQTQLMEVTKRMDLEAKSKTDLKDKLSLTTEKLHETQRAFSMTQAQLEAAQEMERHLRLSLQQKEVALQEQYQHIQNLERDNHDLRELSARNEVILENLKQKRKEDITNIQDKYLAARQVMEQDVNSLKMQLAKQTAQSNNIAEEAQRMANDISGLSQEKFKLEMRVSEQSAAESANARTITSLQQQLRARDQEISVLSIKHQSALEQNRILEEEIQSHKSFNIRKEDELNRIQNNVSEMNRKLREQVGVYMQHTESGANLIPRSPQISNLNYPRKASIPGSTLVRRDSMGGHSKGYSYSSQTHSEPPPLEKSLSHRSIFGLDDLDADLTEFLASRSEAGSNNAQLSGNSFLQRPADGILAPNSLLQ